jgi:hypothetical protein
VCCSAEDGIVLYSFSAETAQNWLTHLQYPNPIPSVSAANSQVSQTTNRTNRMSIDPNAPFTQSPRAQSTPTHSHVHASTHEDDDLATAVLSLAKADSHLLTRSTTDIHDMDMMSTLAAFIHQETAEANPSNMRILLEGKDIHGVQHSSLTQSRDNMQRDVGQESSIIDHRSSSDEHMMNTQSSATASSSLDGTSQGAHLVVHRSSLDMYATDDGSPVARQKSLSTDDRSEEDDHERDSLNEVSLNEGMIDIALDSTHDMSSVVQTAASGPTSMAPPSPRNAGLGSLFGKASSTPSTDATGEQNASFPSTPTAGNSSVKSRAAAFEQTTPTNKSASTATQANTRRRSSMNKLLPEIYEQNHEAQTHADLAALSAHRSNHILQCEHWETIYYNNFILSLHIVF